MGCSCCNYKQTFTEEWGQKYFTIFLPKYCNFSPTKQFFVKRVTLLFQVSSAFLHYTLNREA